MIWLHSKLSKKNSTLLLEMSMCDYTSGCKVLLCADNPKQVNNNSNHLPGVSFCEPSWDGPWKVRGKFICLLLHASLVSKISSFEHFLFFLNLFITLPPLYYQSITAEKLLVRLISGKLQWWKWTVNCIPPRILPALLFSALNQQYVAAIHRHVVASASALTLCML